MPLWCTRGQSFSIGSIFQIAPVRASIRGFQREARGRGNLFRRRLATTVHRCRGGEPDETKERRWRKQGIGGGETDGVRKGWKRSLKEEKRIRTTQVEKEAKESTVEEEKRKENRERNEGRIEVWGRKRRWRESDRKREKAMKRRMGRFGEKLEREMEREVEIIVAK